MNRRFFIRKKPNYRSEELAQLQNLQQVAGSSLRDLALYAVYDVFDASDEELHHLGQSIFVDPLVDELLTEEEVRPLLLKPHLGVTFLEGQYDQRADAAGQSLRLLSPEAKAVIRSSRLFVFQEDLSEEALRKLSAFLINPVEARPKDFSVLVPPSTVSPEPLPTYDGFRKLSAEALEALRRELGLAMSAEDLALVQTYFRQEGREPGAVELRVLDTYWSDHCRHTTFMTQWSEVKNESQRFGEVYDRLLARYRELREQNGRSHKPACLMDLATIVGRDLRRRGLLEEQEVSEEINACSVRVPVQTPEGEESWLLQFKNETHNHPTEIEPFGGASTCLGGAIRDPLSGRAWVYQALRLTGAGDITTPLEETLPGKLPQREISRRACAGYSSYGNQIGLATTAVREFYHPGYVAKRMELGAVVAAVPEKQLRRESPRPGDVVILVGGRTGRDGVGGATGSSKSHDQGSLARSGAEVQKGNPVVERKIQRLFRHPEISRLIRKCNDFGAGGVAVAVGELADGLDIDLDKVPLKYSGLNALELAISESQERMAVLVGPEDVDAFLEGAKQENLEATVIATVTAGRRLRMRYRGELVLDLSRDFLDENGAPRYQAIRLTDRPLHRCGQPRASKTPDTRSEKERLLQHLQEANHASQEGMVEQFDASIGRSTILMPYGGRYQKTEEAVSVQALPLREGTRTCSMMAYGYQPELADDSPYLMAAYSVVEALSRLAAAGASTERAWLSCQEYFRRLDRNEEAWGVVVEALLGLLEAQEAFEVAAIGGKDSMSGSFEDLHVPPTLVTFAISTLDQEEVLSATLPKEAACLLYLPHEAEADGRPAYAALRQLYAAYHRACREIKPLAASALRSGGLAETLTKMALGNRVGLELDLNEEELYQNLPGGLVCALREEDLAPFLRRLEAQGPIAHRLLGHVRPEGALRFHSHLQITQDEALGALEARYAQVYPLRQQAAADPLPAFATSLQKALSSPSPAKPAIDCSAEELAQVRVLLPVFPGTNCEEDTAAAFRAAGATTEIHLLRNLNAELARQDLEAFLQKLEASDILAFSGGFSFGDEPDGSAKFIANFLKSPEVASAVKAFVARDGLVIGICNGFQALVKSGFLPYGDPELQQPTSPTLFHNVQNRHVSTVARTRVSSIASPWLSALTPGQIHAIPVSHGEGRFMVSEEEAKRLFANGQVAFQYVNEADQPTLSAPENPNGSAYAIEGILSPCGRILGKMGHSERYRDGLLQNIPGNKDQELFRSGVLYCARLHREKKN